MGVRIAFCLALDLMAWATGTNTAITDWKIARKRIPTLNDKLINHSVKEDAIVKAGVGQGFKVFYGNRSLAGKKLGDKGPTFSIESCLFHRISQT